MTREEYKSRNIEAAEKEDWRIYDRCAQEMAARGLKGEIGDPLPMNLPVSVLLLINDDIPAFQERVRLSAYAFAMGEK